MQIFFPFCHKDYDQAERWMRWVAHLGLQNHTIVLHPAQQLGEVSGMIELAKKAFRQVLVEPDREGHEGWPEGPNCAFRQAAWYFYNRSYWMFCEPDAIPLTADCFDRLEAEYLRCGKPFMGDVAPAGKGYNRHMSGVAIYPANTPEVSGKTVMAHSMAFDVYDPDPIVANMHQTPLIQHTFFYPEKQVPTFPTKESLSLIRSDAVIFHRNKDGSLIDRLMEQNGLAVEVFLRGEFKLPVNPESKPAGHEIFESTSHVVHTYFEKVDGIDQEQQEWLLSKWTEAWTKEGWIPKILGREIAETHPYFSRLNEKFEALPSVNPKGYDAACLRRYLAMAQVGGGLLVDYDVMPKDFTPQKLAEMKLS